MKSHSSKAEWGNNWCSCPLGNISGDKGPGQDRIINPCFCLFHRMNLWDRNDLETIWRSVCNILSQNSLCLFCLLSETLTDPFYNLGSSNPVGHTFAVYG